MSIKTEHAGAKNGGGSYGSGVMSPDAVPLDRLTRAAVVTANVPVVPLVVVPIVEDNTTDSNRTLTPRQVEILEWIARFVQENQIAPSNREIAQFMGCNCVPADMPAVRGLGSNAAADMIKAIERKGFVRRTGFATSRGIRIVRLPRSIAMRLVESEQ